MKTVAMVFHDEDGNKVRVECNRHKIPASEVQADDYVTDPYVVGFIQVVEARRENGWAVFTDLREWEHYYPAEGVLEVCRPVVNSETS